MKLRPPSASATRRLAELTPSEPRVTVRKMFGQPAAFVNGNLFFGVFGADLFVRLSATGEANARKIEGSRPFEPMAGRPMRGYVILPESVWSRPPVARRWVARALEHAAQLPPKPVGGHPKRREAPPRRGSSARGPSP